MIGAQVSSPRQIRLAVGAFFGLLLAVIMWGTAFWFANSDLQSQFNTKSRVLGDLRRIALPDVSGKGESAATRLAVISAPTETVAASELHKNILMALEETGGSVHSIQAEATADAIGDGLRRLNAQTTFDSSMDSLQKILFELETALPFIFIDSIVVQPAPTSASGAKPWETLRVTLVASSYWKSLEPNTSNR
jgi:general secretion pathway protein M